MTADATSYVVEVLARGESKYVGNGMRWGTVAEATEYAGDITSRWTMVEATKITPTSDPVNYQWTGGKAVRIEQPVG